MCHGEQRHMPGCWRKGAPVQVPGGCDMSALETAPPQCVVCGRKHPGGVIWIYLAGATPVGSMVCSRSCLRVALRRFEATGRVDDPKKVGVS